jgi:hypothetical protein
VTPGDPQQQSPPRYASGEVNDTQKRGDKKRRKDIMVDRGHSWETSKAQKNTVELGR